VSKIDVSKIKPGDLVKIDIRVSPDMEWLPVKGWREVVQERDALCVDEYGGAGRQPRLRQRAEGCRDPRAPHRRGGGLWLTTCAS